MKKITSILAFITLVGFTSMSYGQISVVVTNNTSCDMWFNFTLGDGSTCVLSPPISRSGSVAANSTVVVSIPSALPNYHVSGAGARYQFCPGGGQDAAAWVGGCFADNPGNCFNTPCSSFLTRILGQHAMAIEN